MRNIEYAIMKAIDLHKGQTRKGDGITPYIVHPIEVAMIVSRHTTYEPAIVAALLHDTIEDCEYPAEEIEKEFGPEVRFFVELLTEDKSQPDRKYRKALNIEVLKTSRKDTEMPYLIKAADAISNMRSLVGTLKENGPIVWSNFNDSKEVKLDYYRAILHKADGSLPSEMVEEYAGLLKELELSAEVTLKPLNDFTDPDEWYDHAKAAGYSVPLQMLLAISTTMKKDKLPFAESFQKLQLEGKIILMGSTYVFDLG